jgi:hypothetical protein
MRRGPFGGNLMKTFVILLIAIASTGCATLTEDAMTPVALSFSDGSNGKCNLQNKRGAWPTQVPTTVSVRKSDDALKYDCETEDGRKAVGSIESEMGGKIVASAVFLDLGITDAITDKHRRYAASFVIPMARPAATPVTAPASLSAPAPPMAPATTQPVAPAPAPTPTTEPAVVPEADPGTA